MAQKEEKMKGEGAQKRSREGAIGAMLGILKKMRKNK